MTTQHAKSNAREGDGVGGLPPLPESSCKWVPPTEGQFGPLYTAQDMHAYAISAMQAQQGAEPVGFVLAPVMPTTAMFDAGFAANSKQYAADQMDDVVERTLATYAAMIAAAPATGAPR